MTEGQRRKSGGGWLGLIGKFPLLRSWGGDNGDGKPNSVNIDSSVRKKSVINGSRKRKSDCMGEVEVENVHVDGHGPRKPSFHMPVDASPRARRESVRASAAMGTVSKGSGNRGVETGGDEDGISIQFRDGLQHMEESNRNKKIKIMQEEEERRCSGLPPSTGRNDGNPTYMDLQRLVELKGGCDQVLGLLEKAVVTAVPNAQNDTRASPNSSSVALFGGGWKGGLSAGQPTPQGSIPHEGIIHSSTSTAPSDDGRQCYSSSISSGIVRHGLHTTTATPVSDLKRTTKRLVGLGGRGISDPERRISTQSSARAARRILESLGDMTTPMEGAGNLGESLLYTDSVSQDSSRRWGSRGLSAPPSKSSPFIPSGRLPPLQSMAAESVVHGSGPPETRLVMTGGRQRNDNKGGMQQLLPQEAVAEIPRLEKKPDGGSCKWLRNQQPSHTHSVGVTSREVQVSNSSSSSPFVINVMDNISSPSLYSLERWQPLPKRQRATVVREQQTQTEDFDETWDVRKASLRDGGRHFTMGDGKLLLRQSLSREKKKEKDHDNNPKRREKSMHLTSTSPSLHPPGHFSLSDENDSEDHLDSGDEDTISTLTEVQRKKLPSPLPSGPEHDLDNGEFIFTAPKAVVAPALGLCESQTSVEGPGVEAPMFSFSLPLENRHLSQSNETKSSSIRNKLPFSFDKIKGTNLKTNKESLDSVSEPRIPPAVSKNDGLQDQKTAVKKKRDGISSSPVKGFDMSLFRPKPGQWKCSSCLVVNTESNMKCLACDVPKPAATTNNEEKGAVAKAAAVPLPPPSFPSPPSPSSSTDGSNMTKLLSKSLVPNKPFQFELPPGGVKRKEGEDLSAVRYDVTPLTTITSQEPETTPAKKNPFTFGGDVTDISSFKSKPLSVIAETFTPSTFGGMSSSVGPASLSLASTATAGDIAPIQAASKTTVPSGGGFVFGSAATTSTEAVPKPSNSSLSVTTSDPVSSSPALPRTDSSSGKMASEAVVPPHGGGLSAMTTAAVVTHTTTASTVPELAPVAVKPATFLFGATGSSAPTISIGSSSSELTKPPIKPTFTFGTAPAEKTTEPSTSKIQQSDGMGDKSTGPAIGKPAFTFGATPTPAPAPVAADSIPPAPSSSPPPSVIQQQPKQPTFSFNAPGPISPPIFGGGASTASPTLTSQPPVFGSAPSGISPPSQPGQAFTFNATAGAGGGNSGVPSQNATSMSSSPSFVFGSTPDSQPQQQQPGFSFGAASGVGGQQPGLSFGQSSTTPSPPVTDRQFGGFGANGGGGGGVFPIPQQQQQQQPQASVTFGGFSSQQAPPQVGGGIQQPGPSFGTPMGFGAGVAAQQQQQGGFSMGVGTSHTIKGGGTRGGRKFWRGKRRMGK